MLSFSKSHLYLEYRTSLKLRLKLKTLKNALNKSFTSFFFFYQNKICNFSGKMLTLNNLRGPSTNVSIFRNSLFVHLDATFQVSIHRLGNEKGLLKLRSTKEKKIYR